MATARLNPARNNSRPQQDASHTWRPLRLLNTYRLILSGVFVLIAYTDLPFKPIGDYYPKLYAAIALAYLMLCIVNSFTIAARQPHFITQVYTQAIVDIIAITLIMHASGGVRSGVGMLLIVAVAGSSILLTEKGPIRLAAAATLCMLIEHAYLQLSDPGQSASYTHAGLLGAAFFATALLAHALAKRAGASEALARERGSELASMEQLAQYIIQRMQTGAIVMDKHAHIWLANDSALKLLKMARFQERQHLSEACPSLWSRYQQWLRGDNHASTPFKAAKETLEVIPRFANLGQGGGTLVFLEDTTAMTQQAQQLKLASLGRLSGSIAHEIRNPLGAISHAGQLLAESANLDDSDLRLTEIIRSHSVRMNKIIENVLQLGRRHESKSEKIRLQSWLTGFQREFCQSSQLPTESVELKQTDTPIIIEFDPHQLHQIVWNLCQNAIHHSGTSQLLLSSEVDPESHRPYLDIIDYGQGIPEEASDHIFEPFFTTTTKGTGLGLYIAKELCEYNHAQLSYLPAETGGSCFRITFSDPRRRRNA